MSRPAVICVCAGLSPPPEAKAFKENVIPAQEAVRAVADELATLVGDCYWPLPKYCELLFQY